MKKKGFKIYSMLLAALIPFSALATCGCRHAAAAESQVRVDVAKPACHHAAAAHKNAAPSSGKHECCGGCSIEKAALAAQDVMAKNLQSEASSSAVEYPGAPWQALVSDSFSPDRSGFPPGLSTFPASLFQDLPVYLASGRLLL